MAVQRECKCYHIERVGVGTGSVISIVYNTATGLMRAWSNGTLLASGTFTTRATQVRCSSSSNGSKEW